MTELARRTQRFWQWFWHQVNRRGSHGGSSNIANEIAQVSHFFDKLWGWHWIVDSHFESLKGSERQDMARVYGTPAPTPPPQYQVMNIRGPLAQERQECLGKLYVLVIETTDLHVPDAIGQSHEDGRYID